MDRINLATDCSFSICCFNKIQNIISFINKVYVFNCNPDCKRTYLLLAIF
jgi:hypothetical protein